VCLLGRPWQQHDLGIADQQPLQHLVEERVRETPVVQAHRGRRSEHHDGPATVEAQLVGHAVVRHEVGQGHLLLEPVVRPPAATIEAQRSERLEGDDVGQHDLVGQPEIDAVHARGALVIVQHGAVQAEQPSSDGQVV